MEIDPKNYIDTVKSLTETSQKYKVLRQSLTQIATNINNDDSKYSAMLVENQSKYIIQPSFNHNKNTTTGNQLTLAILTTKTNKHNQTTHPVLFDLIIRRVAPKPANKYYHFEFTARTLNHGNELNNDEFQLYDNLFNKINNLIKED